MHGSQKSIQKKSLQLSDGGTMRILSPSQQNLNKAQPETRSRSSSQGKGGESGYVSSSSSVDEELTKDQITDGSDNSKNQQPGGTGKSASTIATEAAAAAISTANSRVIVPPGVEYKTIPVILGIVNIEFLLFQVNETDHPSVKNMVPLFDNGNVLNCSIAELFEIIRTDEDLVDLHNFTEFDELVLEIPELGGISITEDNIYCRSILVNDFTKILNVLSYRSYLDSESTRGPNRLHFNITSKDRFITNFNNLNDLIRLGYGLDRVAYRNSLLNSERKAQQDTDGASSASKGATGVEQQSSKMDDKEGTGKSKSENPATDEPGSPTDKPGSSVVEAVVVTSPSSPAFPPHKRQPAPDGVHGEEPPKKKK